VNRSDASSTSLFSNRTPKKSGRALPRDQRGVGRPTHQRAVDRAVVSHALRNIIGGRKAGPHAVETSLIDEFLYPKFGPPDVGDLRAEVEKARRPDLPNTEVRQVLTRATGLPRGGHRRAERRADHLSRRPVLLQHALCDLIRGVGGGFLRPSAPSARASSIAISSRWACCCRPESAAGVGPLHDN